MTNSDTVAQDIFCLLLSNTLLYYSCYITYSQPSQKRSKINHTRKKSYLELIELRCCVFKPLWRGTAFTFVLWRTLRGKARRRTKGATSLRMEAKALPKGDWAVFTWRKRRPLQCLLPNTAWLLAINHDTAHLNYVYLGPLMIQFVTVLPNSSKMSHMNLFWFVFARNVVKWGFLGNF